MSSRAPSEGKMSEILLDFARPLIDEFGGHPEDRSPVIQTGIMLWNMAIAKKADRALYKDVENTLIQALGLSPFRLFPEEALNVMGFMIRRWNGQFSWCERMVVDHKIEERSDHIHLAVVSAPVCTGDGGATQGVSG